MSDDLSGQIGEIARRLLGPPNPKLSTKVQLRFGTHGSIAVDIDGSKAGTYHNHELNRGGRWRALLKFEGGIADEEIPAWLKHEGFSNTKPTSPTTGSVKIVATYDYTDESGNILFQVCRCYPKTFFQRAPDGNGGWKRDEQGKYTV